MKRVALVVLAAALLAPAAAHAAEPTAQQKMVSLALAEANRGVQEIPARSNRGPDIRRYHTAVRHAKADEWWCAIFVSWVAKTAGYPIGTRGRGIWNVKNLNRWGHRTGFYFAKGTMKPRAGDISIIGFGHAGIVVGYEGDTIRTVDANWSDTVSVHNEPLDVSGYIRLPSKPRRR